MKPRFEPDLPPASNPDLSASLIDPEAYDASEQQFAASLEAAASRSEPGFARKQSIASRFVVEDTQPEVAKSQPHPTAEISQTQETPAPAPHAEVPQPPDPDAWRREVAARLSHYRARRRTREPRYPSLQLKFESEPIPAPEPMPQPAPTLLRERTEPVESVAVPRITMEEPPSLPANFSPGFSANSSPSFPRILPAVSNEATAKVIEFASYNPAPRALDELAEPVLDRPRIIEAPELAPPPPALGGILIEPVEEPANERRPGFEIPLQAAPMSRRIAASAIDATLVVTAFAAFAYVFFRINAELPALGKIAGAGVILIALFWSTYQYLLLVYSGTTPGLKLAKLELHRFDGSAVPLRIRRWRALTSVLSGLSLGLGYAWCFLDEDRLCWHDRITRTYMAPRK
ncbi:MAG: RDD family protein [Terriglobales bacterium]